MSGGVGPTYKDITLPNERAEEEQQHKLLHDHDDPKSLKNIIKTPAPHHRKSGFFSFRQLNALAVMIVLSASAQWKLFLANKSFRARVLYNSVRMFAILEWLRDEMTKDEKGSTTRLWLYVGRGLAMANIAFWSFNLFGFLLPVCLPKAFQKYYSDLKIKD